MCCHLIIVRLLGQVLFRQLFNFRHKKYKIQKNQLIEVKQADLVLAK